MVSEIMTAEELLGSIIQLALKGKLVRQIPNEGTGTELLESVQKKKRELIKSKIIKKSKPVPKIMDTDIPFDIPETWAWVRVGDIAILNPKNEEPDDEDASFIPMALVEDGYSNNHSFEIRKWGTIKKGFSHFRDGDIGIAKITPCFQNRKSVIFKHLKNGFGAGTTELSIVRPFSDIYDPEFLLMIFKSKWFIDNGVRSFTGTAGQQRINKDYLRTFIMPFPPLAEQKRILAKIKELMPLVNQYAAASEKLNKLNASFPDQLKKSILQQAVQGKLVPQDPSDEPASVLLKKIAAEKQKLIQEGKIKKQKKLPAITEDEIPFEIPKGWEWVRMDDIVSFENGDRGKNYPNKSEYVSSGVAWINTGHIEPNGCLSTAKMNYITKEKFDSLRCGKIQKGDLVFCLRGATYGKVARVEPYTEGAIASSLMIIRPFAIELREYLYLYLKSPLAFSELAKYANGSAQPNLGSKEVRKYLVPIPPLSEQKRIVARLNELVTNITELRSLKNK